MKNKLRYLLLFILTIIFILITILIKKDIIIGFDNCVYNFLTKNSNQVLTSYFKAITLLANYQVILILCILALIIVKDKYIGISIGINSLFSTIVNNIFKRIFSRPRPDVLKLIVQDGYSYPSGHAMASISFYGYIIYLIYKSNINKILKIILTIILLSIILSIGISRIYLGVHYASDIISGYILSLICMIIYIEIEDRIRN